MHGKTQTLHIRWFGYCFIGMWVRNVFLCLQLRAMHYIRSRARASAHVYTHECNESAVKHKHEARQINWYLWAWVHFHLKRSPVFFTHTENSRAVPTSLLSLSIPVLNACFANEYAKENNSKCKSRINTDIQMIADPVSPSCCCHIE